MHNWRGDLESAMPNTAESVGLRERLKAETDARIREMVDDAARRIGAESEAVGLLKIQVEQLQRRRGGKAIETGGTRDGTRRGGVGEHELRRAVENSVLALAPVQVQRLRQILTRPQLALVDGLVRGAHSLLIDRDRER